MRLHQVNWCRRISHRITTTVTITDCNIWMSLIRYWYREIEKEFGQFMCFEEDKSEKRNGHMYTSCKETGCCAVNIPSKEVFLKCIATIENNGYDKDEITISQLSVQKAHKINAPMIAECMVNLECEFEWEHDLAENGYSVVMCFKGGKDAIQYRRNI